MNELNDSREALAWLAYEADDHRLAFHLFLRLAMVGSAAAQCQIGRMYDRGQGVNQNHALAARWYRTAAEQGDAQAQCNLGFCYKDGEGVKRDPARAAAWFRRAARPAPGGSLVPAVGRPGLVRSGDPARRAAEPAAAGEGLRRGRRQRIEAQQRAAC